MMEATAKELEPPPQGSTATKKWSVFSLGLRGLWTMRSGMRRNLSTQMEAASQTAVFVVFATESVRKCSNSNGFYVITTEGFR
jgi:hypothetical protein